MKIANQTFTFIGKRDYGEMLKKIERIGRVCYKSEGKITDDSAEGFVRGIVKRGHESVIEHETITVNVICDRGVSHEIVRHRIASYSQESTRYCNYSKDAFGNELTFIFPTDMFNDDELGLKQALWADAMKLSESTYLRLIEAGARPEEARGVLPNALKTEIVMTMNLREWRHFFKLRCDKSAHPQMREVACMLRDAFIAEYPAFFDDLK